MLVRSPASAHVRDQPGVVAEPHTWRLAKGWTRHGLLDAHAIPSRVAA